MIRGKCPTCGRPFAIDSLDDLPTFPFCNDRCKLVDLGRWIDGSNAIPGPEPKVEDEPDAGDEAG